MDILYADFDQSLTVYKKTIKNRKYSTEVINKRKSGELFISIISASVLVERGGKVLGLMGISRDISDWKRVEVELKRAKEEAEAANHAKSEFLAHMSHEIRTLLTSVIGYGELLEGKLSDKSEFYEYVQCILRNGHHLLCLIDDILDLSRVEKGKLFIQSVLCHPSHIVAASCHILQNKISEKNINLHVEYLSKIPETIESDPTRILQCLVNLVGNAIKFTHADGNVKFMIDFVTENEKPLLRFQIKDDGVGIESDQLDLILQPFEQGHINDSLKISGVGLGLTITRQLAELLDGSLSVTSELNKGSTFTLKNCLWKEKRGFAFSRHYPR